MNNEELDSQLSAMFDDELPPSECELLARRLARDEAIKARWGRYATIGAAIRREPGLRLDGDLARRVSAAIASEPSLLAPSKAGQSRSRAIRRWWQPVAGAAVAAGVAALSVLWLRAQSPAPVLAAASAPVLSTPLADTSAPDLRAGHDSYTVPREVEPSSFMPASQLANFVVLHSEFSNPMLRSNVLSAVAAAELGGIAVTPARAKANRTPDAHEAP